MAQASPTTLGFLTWSSSVPTGGNVYDDRLTESLLAAGADLHRHHVRGVWPRDSEQHRAAVAAVLRSRPVWLVDSIIACAVPDLVAEATERGQRVIILLHSLLSSELGLSETDQQRYRALEAAALRAASRVVTPSQWAADDLRQRYGITDTAVARPGVEASPLTAGSPSGNRLLSLGSLTPTKDQLGFAAALSRVAQLPWSARLVGGDRVRPDYTAALRRSLRQQRLDSRIMITGPLTGSALDGVWADTDLLVLTSRSETYAMVVAEALAHGIPAVVTGGTGAVEALGQVDGIVPGTAVPAGDTATLTAVLQRWLTDQQLRDEWRAAARRRRDTLTTWSDCAAIVLTALVDP